MIFGRYTRRPEPWDAATPIGVGPRLSRKLRNLLLYLYGLAEAEGDAGGEADGEAVGDEAGYDVGGPVVAGAGETGADEPPGAAVGLEVE